MLNALQQVLSIIIAPIKAIKSLFFAIQDEDKSLMKQSLIILVVGAISSILLSIIGAITLKECITLNVGFFLWTCVLGFTTCDELFFSILYSIKDLILELCRIIKPGEEDVSEMKLFKVSATIKEKVVKQKPNDGSDWSQSEVQPLVEDECVELNETEDVNENIPFSEEVKEDDEFEISEIKEDVGIEEDEENSLLNFSVKSAQEVLSQGPMSMSGPKSIPVAMMRGQQGIMSRLTSSTKSVEESAEESDIDTDNITY